MVRLVGCGLQFDDHFITGKHVSERAPNDRLLHYQTGSMVLHWCRGHGVIWGISDWRHLIALE